MAAKRYTDFSSFGDLLYYSYANLNMLCYAMQEKKGHYDRSCYMVRSMAYKAYREGRWRIHDLLVNNVAKIVSGNVCWYCGEVFDKKEELTIDHVFPRSKGGDNSMDNIIMVCKHCNSSKGSMDLFEWYVTKRQVFPPIDILQHYLKQIYLFSVENGLLSRQCDEIEQMKLPFNYRYIPLDYPQPEYYK